MRVVRSLEKLQISELIKGIPIALKECNAALTVSSFNMCLV